MAEPGLEVIERLTKSLRDAGIAFTRMHHEPVHTSAEAAAVRGTSLHSGAKALILKVGESFVMAVMPADLALDSVALRKLLGCRKSRFAGKEELFERTGLTPGSVPPFGSLFNLPTICDGHLADNETINFNAGSHSDSIQMAYNDYIAYESPRIADITRPA